MSNWTTRQAASFVLKGGVIAYPTEAVYGLGCSPYDGRAVARLLQIKQRDPAQGLILIGRGLADFADFIQPLDASVKDKITATWPGPFTWVLPASDSCPLWLRGRHQGIAVRVTAHAQCRRLCELADMAMVSTSANRHGKSPAVNAMQVRQRFGAELDYILAGSTSSNGQLSEIRDAITDQLIR